MTVTARYPYTRLLSVGGRLAAISGELDCRDVAACSGIGLCADQQRIVEGIGLFRDEWGPSIAQLTQNIGDFGELSTGIGIMVADSDARLAAAIRPGVTGRSATGGRALRAV